MSFAPEKIGLVCVGIRAVDTTEAGKLALSSGIGNLLLLEPSAEGGPHVEEQKHGACRVLRLRSSRIHETGASLRLGLACACRRDLEVVVIWTGHELPSADALSRVLERLAAPDISSVEAHPSGWRGWVSRWGGLNSLVAYRTAALKRIPFHHNTADDHFTYEVSLQLRATNQGIATVLLDPSVFRGSLAGARFISHGLRCLAAQVRCRVNRLALIYHPKFDFLRDEDRYIFKQQATSLHQHVLRYPIRPGMSVIELGAGQGHISRAFHKRGAEVLAMDLVRPPQPFPFPFIEHDLEGGFADAVLEKHGPVDLVIMLDVIEHLAEPERAILDVWRILKPGGTLLLSTGNVAFLPIRFMLLAGLFNYGRRGILDLTHRRLFTYKSMQRLLIGADFLPRRWVGFGPPVADLIGKNGLLMLMDRFGAAFARLRPSLFAYQLYVEAERVEGIRDVLGFATPSSQPSAMS